MVLRVSCCCLPLAAQPPILDLRRLEIVPQLLQHAMFRSVARRALVDQSTDLS
jgi:hypothetical protein